MSESELVAQCRLPEVHESMKHHVERANYKVTEGPADARGIDLVAGLDSPEEGCHDVL